GEVVAGVGRGAIVADEAAEDDQLAGGEFMVIGQVGERRGIEGAGSEGGIDDASAAHPAEDNAGDAEGGTEEAGDHEYVEAVERPQEGAEHGEEFHVALAHGFLAKDDGADEANGPEEGVADGGAGAGVE